MLDVATLRQYLQVCGLNNADPNRQTQQFIDSQGLTGIEDFVLLQGKDVKGMIKNHNDAPNVTRLGYIHQRNIEALVHWVKDQTRRQLPLTIANWNAAALTRAITERQIEEQKGETLDTPQRPTKIKTGLEWYDWSERFHNYIMQMKGVTGISLDYVIRKDMPAGWDPATDASNEHEHLKYQVALTGPIFETDAQTVYKKLGELTLDEEAYTWIESEETSMNGRRAWLCLTDHFESAQWVGRCVTEAEKILKDASYTNEYTYSFEKLMAALHNAYVVLEKNDQPYNDRMRVKRLAQAINMPNNVDVRVAKRYIQDNHPDDWLAASSNQLHG